MANLRDKNDRATLAFIKPAAQAIDPLVRLCPTNSSNNRSFFEPGDAATPHAIIDCVTSQGPEDPPFSGNHWLDVKLRISYPGIEQPDESDQARRVALGQMVDAVYDCLHQSDDGQSYKYVAAGITAAGNALATTGTADEQTRNADMTDYTCQDMRGVTYLGAPEEGAPANAFVEIMRFQVYACPVGLT